MPVGVKAFRLFATPMESAGMAIAYGFVRLMEESHSCTPRTPARLSIPGFTQVTAARFQSAARERMIGGLSRVSFKAAPSAGDGSAG